MPLPLRRGHKNLQLALNKTSLRRRWLKSNRAGIADCSLSYRPKTRNSAIADGPCDASCQLKSCQLPRNSAEATCTTSPEQIEVMKLEGYRKPMCNKHVHSIMTRSSRFHFLIGVINKPTTDTAVDITCTPTTCCGEIF